MRVLVAHPSPDVYGSDRQLVLVVSALALDGGNDVTVCMPSGGALAGLLADAGARVLNVRFPVLRRSLLSVTGVAQLLWTCAPTVVRLTRLIHRCAPDVVYVNTTTIPWWAVAARLAGVPVVVHVHEAEEDWPAMVRWLLAAPLLLARSVTTNSEASLRVLTRSLPRLSQRSRVIYNGIEGPDVVSPLATGSLGVTRLTLVARLSARKGVDIALEALALLRGAGRPVELDVCGTAYAGYEWFEQQLHERGAQPDLAGAVKFHGYVNPTWDLLSSAAVVLVPSRAEPFGNTAVEAQLAQRPVIASRVQGLPEIVEDDRTGVLVEPGDPEALAAAIARLIDHPDLAADIAAQARAAALQRFPASRFRTEIREWVESIGKPVVAAKAAKAAPAVRWTR